MHCFIRAKADQFDEDRCLRWAKQFVSVAPLIGGCEEIQSAELSKRGACYVKSIRLRRVTFCHLVLVAIFPLIGCGLTKSQLAATQSFAKASKSYPAAPAAVITTYADVYIAQSALQASTVKGASAIWTYSGQQVSTYDAEQSDAKKLSAALQVVTQYGDLLTKLSSSDFSEADEKAAGSLSKSINSSIDDYNKETGGTLPSSIGDGVAEAVGALGEIYVRRRQAEELKAYVLEADPIVAALTKEVDRNLADMQNLLSNAECDLAHALCNRQGLVIGKRVEKNETSHNCTELACLPDTQQLLISPESAEILLQAREKVTLAQQAIESAKKAGNQMRDAHQALAKSLQQTESIGDAIQQIEQFAQAVSSANAKAKTASSVNASSTKTDSTN